MVSYAAAAARQSVSGSANRSIPAEKVTTKTSSAAATTTAVSPPPPPPQVPVKVTALLTRNGQTTPTQKIGRTKNVKINNNSAASKPSPSSPSLPTGAGGGGPSPSPTKTQPQPHDTKTTTAGSQGGGISPKNSSGKQQKQLAKTKTSESPQSQSTSGAASNKKKGGPSPGPFKILKPSPKEITLGDLIKKQQQQPSRQINKNKSKKMHNKPQSSSSQPSSAQQQQYSSNHQPPLPRHRAADPAPLTMDNFPALSSISSSVGPSSAPAAAAAGSRSGLAVVSKGKQHEVGTKNVHCKAAAAAPAAPTPPPMLTKQPTENTTKSKIKKAKTNGSPKSKTPNKSAVVVAGTTSSSKSSSLGMASLLGPKATISDADMMKLRGRDNEGRGHEHDLLRLMEKRQITSFPAGRQRIRPRKKKFTALKKKVLEERLLNWRQLHPASSVIGGVNDKSNTLSSAKDESGVCIDINTTSTWRTVCIHGFAEIELSEDDDEYEELVANLQEMASKIGLCKRIFIPRGDPIQSSSSSSSCQPAFVEFDIPADACAAVSCWHGLSLGGSPIQAQHLNISNDDASFSTEDWQQQCFAMAKGSTGDDGADPRQNTGSETAKVILENILTQDDMEDEDCLTESLDDCRTLAEQFGHVQEILVEREAMQLIVVYLGGLVVARQAAKALGQTVIAGTRVSATVMGDETVVDAQSKTSCDDRVILLHGALTEEDLEDEECLEESLNDIRELALQFGPVEAMAVEGASIVRIQFSVPDDNVVKAAAAGFNGMVIGGLAIKASLPEGIEAIDEALLEPASIALKPKVAEDKQEPSPMFSGDKRIPERFAECKRVPKIPNASVGVPRHYAALTGDDTVKPLLIEMLGELMRLQKRAVEENNTKAKRRLVLGLREVARGIRSHKTKMVVMANNLDEYGIIDDKLQQILDLCREEGVPVFFEFNKRGLGKAIGKSIKVAVIGIQNAEGAHQQFKKLARLAPALPIHRASAAPLPASSLATDIKSPS